MSFPSVFTISNLFYVPLSITIAYILNFVINSPLSIWQEVPPRLPNSVYSSIFLTPFLLFISLTFEPIQTRKRFYTLLFLTLSVISIPISFHGGKYPLPLQFTFVFIAIYFGLKMLLFLKFNRTYLNQKKEFRPFLLTLFNWRVNSYIIPPSEISNDKENPLIIKSPTTSQINKKLINRFIITFGKWSIFELSTITLLISTNCVVEIPKTSYQIRLIEFITKGNPPVTMSSMLNYLNFIIVLYLWLSLNYDVVIILVTIVFRFFFHSTSENDSILVRSNLLTPSKYIDLKEWIITFIFNTKHLLNEPWMSSSPRDFWSVRWQLVLNEGFKELGYLPVRNLFAPIVSKKIANMMGVLSAFGLSGLFHEYIMIANFDIRTGDHFFFFMTHGIILIFWEIIFGYEKKNEVTKIKRFLKLILLVIINLIIFPAFIESFISNYKLSELSSFSSYFC